MCPLSQAYSSSMPKPSILRNKKLKQGKTLHHQNRESIGDMLMDKHQSDGTHVPDAALHYHQIRQYLSSDVQQQATTQSSNFLSRVQIMDEKRLKNRGQQDSQVGERVDAIINKYNKETEKMTQNILNFKKNQKLQLDNLVYNH